MMISNKSMSVLTPSSKSRYPRICVLQVTFSAARVATDVNVISNSTEFDFTVDAAKMSDRRLLVSGAQVDFPGPPPSSALRMTFTSTVPVLRGAPRAMVSGMNQPSGVSAVLTVDDVGSTDFQNNYDIRIGGTLPGPAYGQPAVGYNLVFLVTFYES